MLQRFPKCYDRNGQLCILLSWDMSRISPDSAGRFFYPVPEHEVYRRMQVLCAMKRSFSGTG
jgi:hypothetical protein